MPELPEVQTTVNDLKKYILGLKIEDVWSDTPKIVKKPASFSAFKKGITGRKMEKIERRAKNILFRLSGGKTLLVHQKMTGHFLYGKWQKKGGKWLPENEGSLCDPMNRFIHLIFFLNNGKQLSLSDLRKFAKAELWDSEELKRSKKFSSIGPEPLDKRFTFKKFKEAISGKKGKIKQVLMDQSVIAGIGNIYSDEILWQAMIHPLRLIKDLTEKDLKNIYGAMIEILEKAIKLRGESFSDYRDPSGNKGYFDIERKAYRREGEVCFICGNKIKRMKIGGRSAHFCPNCQKI